METNEKIPLVFVLHAYQPITQKEEVYNRIISKCYIPFLRKLLENPEIKITLNISGCLLEKFATNYPDVLHLIEEGILSKQIELMGSAFYHPILPLILKKDQRYQINKQKELTYNILGVNSSVFFPPELAISEEIIPQIVKEGYKIILVPENINNLKIGGYYELEDGKSIFLIKRNKKLSNNIAFNLYNGNVNEAIEDIRDHYDKQKCPILLAMDLETFGEHHKRYYNFFFELAKSTQMKTLSKSIGEFPLNKKIKNFLTTSWSTSDQDLEDNIPLPLWNHPFNAIHQLQQSHISFLERVREFIEKDEWFDDYQSSLYSCQFWWASRDWWSPELILTGLQLQRKTLIKMIDGLPKRSKQIIFNLSNDIIQRIIDLVEQKGEKNEDSIRYS
ncbi:MAG: hypothetical protein ACFFDS_05000 [Candidatus Thorarchaeota archaeon]